MTSNEITIEKEDIERIFLGFALEAQKQLTSNLQKPKKRAIVLAGPTACGKSALGMSLADLMHGEIISADSMQVYRNMDIGTAKSSKEERERIPHHLIDIRDINESFNVVDFYYEARHCCQQVHARESVPLIVGGSGFYLHSLLYGPPSGPPSVPELRKTLEDEIEKLGSEVLFERLKHLDPEYASTITKNDKQKIVRALEILTLTGKKVSKLSWQGRRKPQNYDFRCWFLCRPRDLLYKRIEERCDKMIENGFLEEVAALDKQGLRLNSSASQAIG
ncbi:MAG: tRNA (adenosine(37)-N6)-dimethylallyltransferase MiaA, partial [Parachlamydiaceae bacterium]|nr:tRNA (adenosine(37)-N6)-dimethylallyltransferase MiaA [Parachlamydiaceae bacterium]